MGTDDCNRDSANRAGFSRDALHVPFTMRELHRSRRFRSHLVALVAAVAVMAYLAPFGTGAFLGPFGLVGYWGAAIGVNWLIAVVVISFSVRVMEKAEKPSWTGTVIGALAAAVPGTGVVFVLESGFGRAIESAGTLLYVYSCVALVMLVVGFFVSRLIEEPLRRTAKPRAAPREPGGAPFLERLAPSLGRELLHLHMRDHYVEAHTAKGSELILLRFSDALREVDRLDGMQVHRSHWVAARAVAGASRRGGRTLLRLVNGAEVPVSRTFAPALRERGWI